MKRDHDELSDDENLDEAPSSSRPRIEEEVDILKHFQSNLASDENLNNHINKRLFETQKQYFTVYMEKLMYQIPMGKNLVEIVRGKENNFEYMFTAAKSIIQSQMNVKKIKSLHAVFDMVYGIGFRFIHEKLVSPSLTHMVNREGLDRAYEAYTKSNNVDEDSSTLLEMQSLLYCIQETIDKNESVRVPNPLYGRVIGQFKSLSDYVIALLMHASTMKTRVEQNTEEEREELTNVVLFPPTVEYSRGEP